MTKRKLTKSGTPSPPKSVVDKLDLIAIGLDSLNASLDRSNYATAYGSDNKRITKRIESSYHVSDYSEEHFDITGTLYLRVEADGFGEPILSVDIVVTAHFHPTGVKSTPPREEAEEFAKAEARLIFWPYFRQLVSDTTSRMHVRTITLPLAAS